MDTPEFQRLRRVRQLGMAYYAYPSAVHTRFEHSIGVSHLASKMVDQLRRYVLRQKQPLPYSTEKLFDPRTKDLIQLAGLYHDIGHFAYSHMFDAFLSKVEFEGEIPEIFKYKDHEDRSIYFLRKVNARLQLLTPEEEQFVINCILGIIPEGEPAYLYQIVCNEECGVDMDKADYLRRDSYHCGMPGFQADYIILNTVIDNNGYLAFREKTRSEIRDLFATRARMYENVYQHHTSLKMDKIYFCMMKRLGVHLLTFGEKTDDFNIETLIRSTPELEFLVTQVETRQLEHDCEICSDYIPVKSVKASGGVDRIRSFL
jgi:HD superfamily phosphohydrolase